MRIPAWYIGLLPFSVGFVLTASTYSNLGILTFILAILSFLAAGSFTLAINFYSDKEVDKLHDGKKKDIDLRAQPFVTGELSKREGMIFLLILFFLSLIGFMVNFRYGVMLLIILILGIIYSINPFRFKGKPILDIIVNVGGVVISFFLGMNLQDLVLPHVSLVLWVIFNSANSYLLLAISDFKFDKKMSIMTTAVYLGIEKSLKLWRVFWFFGKLIELIILVSPIDILIKIIILLKGVVYAKEYFTIVKGELHKFVGANIRNDMIDDVRYAYLCILFLLALGILRYYSLSPI
jgi:4-hydroxybenzoate polyprenyltransferase